MGLEETGGIGAGVSLLMSRVMCVTKKLRFACHVAGRERGKIYQGELGA